MKFEVFIQDAFYKTFEIDSTNVFDIVSLVTKDIENGLVANFDKKSDANIKIKPISKLTNNLEKNNDHYISGPQIKRDDGFLKKLDKEEND